MNENINAMIHLLYISIILNFNKYRRKKTYARAFRPGKRERERERERQRERERETERERERERE